MSRGYNGWTAEERNRLGDIQYQLLNRNPHYRQQVCRACGQTKGVVQHLEDYSEPLRGIIGLCCRCHVAVHERVRYPKMWERYCRAIREGWMFRRGTNWRDVLRDMCWSVQAFGEAVPGPERGDGILDEIATGKWERIGPHADNLATGSAGVSEQQSMFDVQDEGLF